MKRAKWKSKAGALPNHHK